MRMRTAVAGAALAGLLVGGVRPADASILSVLTDLLDFAERYVVPLLVALDPMPPTIDGKVLAGTQTPIGSAPGSYVTGSPPSANPLFPDGGNADWNPPDGATQWAALREQDRKRRADEAEAEASAIIADDKAATARLDGYVLRNAVPDESIAGNIKLGTDVQVETAGQLHKLTQLQAEANQLEADQRVQEDWQRQQQDNYARAWNKEGYWTGTRTWTPGTIVMPH